MQGVVSAAVLCDLFFDDYPERSDVPTLLGNPAHGSRDHRATARGRVRDVLFRVAV